MTLLAFAAERRAAPPLQQTRRTPLMLSNDETDRQTDGRTLDIFIDPAPRTMYAGSVENILFIIVSDCRR